jgi:hypothetical protein
VAEGEELGSNLLHVGQRGGEQPYGGWSLPPCAIVTMTDRYDKRLVDRKKSVPCRLEPFKIPEGGFPCVERTHCTGKRCIMLTSQPSANRRAR